MVLAQAQQLQDYLRAVRRVALRRTLTSLAIDLLLLGCGWLVILVALAGWSLRGDLAAQVGGVVGLLGGAALVSARIRELRERLGNPVMLARAIAKHPGEREADVILRHELLGATELWMQLEADQCSSPELAAAYVRRIGDQTYDLDPRRALPRPRRRIRLIGAALILGAAVGLASAPIGARGL
jgi:hypothetical protein